MIDLNKLKARVDKYILMKSISPSALALKCNMSGKTLIDWMRGKRKINHLSSVKLDDYLNKEGIYE